jgi:ubiquitin-conjugating enzyme E2 J1
LTKYHKDEWQAAWTIRSMLEAIIAFFPIKEDHDAIGALESSTESRKYYAKQSVKYKCDICGPIANILKPIEKFKNNNNDNKSNNNNEKDEKNDENAENVENKNTDNNNIDNNNNSADTKNNKNPKIIPANIKKDIDSSSNSSLSSNQTGKFKFRNTSDNKKIYLKKANNNNNANKEILLNSKEENNNNNINNNEQDELFNYINPEPEPNSILKSIMDDIEYMDIKKSIQFHGNKTNQEIESNLLSKKNNKNLNSLQDFFKIKKFFDKELELKIEEDNKSMDELNQNKDGGFFNKSKVMNEKEICEKKLKENIKYIKFFSRKNYEDIRDKTKWKFNIWMFCFMFLVLIFYLIGQKYQSSFHKIIKHLLLAKK